MNTNISTSHKKRSSKKGIIFILLLLICLTISLFFVINSQSTDETIDPPTPFTNNIPGKQPVINPATVAPSTMASHISTTTKTKEKVDISWSLALVNKWNPLSSDARIELTELSNGESVDKRIYPYLQKMFDTARSKGIYPVVVSGYRTEQDQEDMYNEKVSSLKSEGLSADKAKQEAESWVATPGTSEHQLGLAVDINGDGVHSKSKAVYKWLEKNAHLYGFIYRYPKDKVDITGIANEPWHYRYVGVNVAKEMHESGMCLEEYLDSKQ